jgi:hypothetical protein
MAISESNPIPKGGRGGLAPPEKGKRQNAIEKVVG